MAFVKDHMQTIQAVVYWFNLILFYISPLFSSAAFAREKLGGSPANARDAKLSVELG